MSTRDGPRWYTCSTADHRQSVETRDTTGRSPSQRWPLGCLGQPRSDVARPQITMGTEPGCVGDNSRVCAAQRFVHMWTTCGNLSRQCVKPQVSLRDQDVICVDRRCLWNSRRGVRNAGHGRVGRCHSRSPAVKLVPSGVLTTPDGDTPSAHTADVNYERCGCGGQCRGWSVLQCQACR